ncbi:hypothetical protein MMC21_007144 [Puttea exsequens]|nr:hypothetical protein [Puttea exsequens]
MPSSSSSSSSLTPTLIALLILSTFVAIAVGLYFSPYKDDIRNFVLEKYFKAEAKAEEKALEKAGATKAEGFLKDRLKKNPVMGSEELEGVQAGLGEEAKSEGLGGKIGKAFD